MSHSFWTMRTIKRRNKGKTLGKSVFTGLIIVFVAKLDHRTSPYTFLHFESVSVFCAYKTPCVYPGWITRYPYIFYQIYHRRNRKFHHLFYVWFMFSLCIKCMIQCNIYQYKYDFMTFYRKEEKLSVLICPKKRFPGRVPRHHLGCSKFKL